MTLYVPSGREWVTLEDARSLEAKLAADAEQVRREAEALAAEDWSGMSEQALKQIEHHGAALRIWRDRGDDMSVYPPDLETTIARSDKAEAELTRRGCFERYT